MKIFDGKWYCEDCFFEEFRICDYCHQAFLEDEITFWENNNWCPDCLADETSVCDNCGERVYQRYITYVGDNAYCDGCAPEYATEVESISIPFRVISSKGYKVNPYKNFCGVEIECLNNNIEGNAFTYDELKKYQFSQVPDGSLETDTGAEFVSNPFNGDALLFTLKQFCGELSNRAYYVEKSCGLHIHIKINKRLEFIKKVYAFYLRFEGMFFRMLPKSRQHNSYCSKLSQTHTNIDLANISACKKSIEFQKLLYDSSSQTIINRCKKDKYNNKRYSWINFHSLFYRGTLEIRNHSGTISFDKIKNWLLIHLRILDFIRHLSFETICHLPQTDEFFLSLFDTNLNKYIQTRWEKFTTASAEEGN